MGGADHARITNPDPLLVSNATAPPGSDAEAALLGLIPVTFTPDSRYFVPGGAIILIFINNTVRESLHMIVDSAGLHKFR